MSNVFRAVAVVALTIATSAGDAFAETRRDRDRVIANEGDIASHWKLADGAIIAAPAYPAEHDNDDRPDACVALQYTIFPDGTTGDFRVVRTWKSGPASRTEMRPFWLKFARAGVAALRAHCRITDLAVLVRSFERTYTLVSSDMDRKYRAMDRIRQGAAGPH